MTRTTAERAEALGDTVALAEDLLDEARRLVDDGLDSLEAVAGALFDGEARSIAAVAHVSLLSAVETAAVPSTPLPN